MKEYFSYCENELTVLTWDQAFVFDDRAGADTVDSIIEFANTQLVELRTYDRRLDRHLDEIYRSKSRVCAPMSGKVGPVDACSPNARLSVSGIFLWM